MHKIAEIILEEIKSVQSFGDGMSIDFKYDITETGNRIKMAVADGNIGYIIIGKRKEDDNYEVKDISVDSDYRRNGIATILFNDANKYLKEKRNKRLYHADENWRTEFGSKFVNSFATA